MHPHNENNVSIEIKLSSSKTSLPEDVMVKLESCPEENPAQNHQKSVSKEAPQIILKSVTKGVFNLEKTKKHFKHENNLGRFSNIIPNS